MPSKNWAFLGALKIRTVRVPADEFF